MPKTADKPRRLAGYKDDFFLWTQQQATLLSERRFAELDLAHLIDEVASVGRSEKREIQSRLTALLVHLVKWKYQPRLRCSSWTNTIVEQRLSIGLALADSPSLARYPESVAQVSYRIARAKAANEAGLDLSRIPVEMPFTLAQALDDDFLPGQA